MDTPKFEINDYDILSTLALFDERLPKTGLNLYTPSADFNPGDVVSLAKEGERILDFLGLVDYTVLITRENLADKHAAGRAEMGRIIDNVLYIDIDVNTLRDRDAALRVMAHEVCHKYLEIHGLFANFGNEDELRAELATIFTGLGCLTLCGYRSHTGYLSITDFVKAFCYVYYSRGMQGSEILRCIPTVQRPLAACLLTELENNAQAGLAEQVRLTTQQCSHFHHHVLCAKELIAMYEQQINQRRARQDEIVAAMKAGQLRPLRKMALSAKLQRNYKDVKQLADNAAEACEAMFGRLYQLDALPREIEILHTQRVVCPACGYSIKPQYGVASKVLSCPKCHHIFYWDATPLRKEDYKDATHTEAPEETPARQRGFFGKLFSRKKG